MQPFFGKRFRYRKQSKQDMVRMMRENERNAAKYVALSPRQRRAAFRLRLGYALIALALGTGLIWHYFFQKPETTWTPPPGVQPAEPQKPGSQQ